MSSEADVDRLLEEQKAYYRARAPEYDHWWERSHQYSLEGEDQERWYVERSQLENMVAGWLVGDGPILELACGTGIWTERLAATGRPLTAVDAAAETIAIARDKVAGATVEFVHADLFDWEPEAGAFDTVFFSFWLSHVPPDRFDAFWAMVGRALAPGGRAILIDNKWRDGVWPLLPEKPKEFVQERTDLSSGETHRVVKLYYEPDELEARLAGLGWTASVTATDRFFVAGYATRD